MKFKNEIFVVMVSVSGNGKAVRPIDDLSPITEVIACREFRNYREIGFFFETMKMTQRRTKATILRLSVNRSNLEQP